MEKIGEESLSFPLLKSGKRQKVHLGRSVSTHFIADCWLSINGCSHLKNKKTVWQWFDGIKQYWLAQKFGLRWLQRLYEIQAESPSFSSPLSARRKEAPLARGREGGGGGEILTWLSWLFVCLIHTYILLTNDESSFSNYKYPVIIFSSWKLIKWSRVPYLLE